MYIYIPTFIRRPATWEGGRQCDNYTIAINIHQVTGVLLLPFSNMKINNNILFNI